MVDFQEISFVGRYQRTIVNKGTSKYVVSAPYKDQWGSGNLITISTNLIEQANLGYYNLYIPFYIYHSHIVFGSIIMIF